MWIRQHQEGPIDDRWTSLRLEENESTGELRIVEARKEWYLGSSKSQRTYYTTGIVFPEPLKNDVDFSILSAVISTDPNFLMPFTSFPVAAAISSHESTLTVAFLSFALSTSIASSSTVPASTSTTTASQADERDFSAYSNVPLLRLIKEYHHPHHINAPERRPERTHPSNDAHNSSHTLIPSLASVLTTHHAALSSISRRSFTRRLARQIALAATSRVQ